MEGVLSWAKSRINTKSPLNAENIHSHLREFDDCFEKDDMIKRIQS